MYIHVKKFLILISLLIMVSSEGINGARKPRIFSFNPDDVEDFEVGFDFSIPFLKIPLKKTFDAVAEFGFPGIGLPKININPTALILSGLIIFTTSVFAPLLNKATDWQHLDRTSRTATENETNEAHLYLAEKLLANSGGCPERIACWSSQKSKNSDVMKTLKQIMSNELLLSMVNTTALEIATLKGRSGHNCELYTPCPIDEKAIPKIVHSFAMLANMKLRENV